MQDLLVSISLTPSNASIVLGSDQPFTVTGKYLSGITQDFTNSVSWSSSSAGVATISSSGLAVVSRIGQTVISASWAPPRRLSLWRLHLSEQGFRVLYTFTGGQDGVNPEAGLISDPSRNFYGTTSGG